ncbi:helix-turn-helix domain-containing protein [Ktedonospora formicarum]|uniref:Transcriptional regulator n=1 Tax=Ktedonospora formicarum TaxID=2778364 RepID=A0A8J3HXJ8_9CHLR|nr:helix-turn-helix domain-containing protein [Ktedonospora formicarum]GHO43831.1 transcriptional regulator [Ktedonospora formicarum]
MKSGQSMEFPQLIAQFRHKRGMSQGQLAQATRLSRTYIYHLETGQRANPSPHVVQLLAKAFELMGDEKQELYGAYTRLTGHYITQDSDESTLLDLGDLASLLVHNTSYPAHALSKLWYLHSWNEASLQLFEIFDERAFQKDLHLLRDFVFDPQMRQRLHGWENLARRLVSDFQYNASTSTHLPEYKALRKELRSLSEYRRIANSIYSQGKPAPSFVFQVQHSTLGRLTLRTATTVFSGMTSYSMVSYVPGDQQTLRIYREQGWQPE